MPSIPPGRSLSAKFLKLGRLRTAKTPEDTTSPAEERREFQIVHTPDRLTPDRPVPTEEECRREIKQWHAAADKERFGFVNEENAVRQVVGETYTRGRLRRTDGQDRLRNKYEFRDSDEEESDRIEELDGGVRGDRGKEKGNEVVDVMSNRGDVVKKNSLATARDSTNRRIIDPVVFDLEEDEKEKNRREREESTNRRLIREMGGLESPPIFQPPRPHRDVDDQRWITGKYEAPREAPRPVVQLTPPRPAFAKPVVRRSASTADLELMNDVSGDEGAGKDDGREVDLDWLIKTELYKRGVCPECRNMRSNIEVFRCSRCGSDLVGYIRSGKPQDMSQGRGRSSPSTSTSKALPLPISRFITTSSGPTETFRAPGPVSVSAPTSRHRTPVPGETSVSRTPVLPTKSSLRRRREGDGSTGGTESTPKSPLKDSGEMGNLRVRFADPYNEGDRSRHTKPSAPPRPQRSRSPISGFHEYHTQEQRAGLVRMSAGKGQEAEVLMDIYDSYYD